MKKIVDGFTRLQRINGLDEEEAANLDLEGSSGFRVQLGGEEEGSKSGGGGGGGRKMPWARAETIVFRREKKLKEPTAAERTLPEAELARLRGEARGIREWVKVRKAGVTAEKVEEIRKAWRESELAMLKFGLPLCRNMERAMEIVEVKISFFFLKLRRRKCNYLITLSMNYKLYVFCLSSNVGFSFLQLNSRASLNDFFLLTNK